MADQDNDSDTTTPVGEAAPDGAADQVLPAGDEPAAEPTEPALEETEEVPAPEEPEAPAAQVLTADEATLAAAAIPTRAAAPTEETAPPRYGAQFSSPEPTTVTARPRRRATRPALSADPDSVEPPVSVAPTLPAFVSFVAPPEEAPEPAAPRRRSRRATAETPVETPAEPEQTSVSPEPETTVSDRDDEPAADEAPAPRRGRSRRRAVAPEPEVVAEEDETPEVPVEDAEDDRSADDDGDDDSEQDGEDDDIAAVGSRRRRRGRRGRGRGRSGEDTAEDDGDPDAGGDQQTADTAEDDVPDAEDSAEDDEAGTGSSTRRRRRRRSRGERSTVTAEDTTDADEGNERPERAGRGGRTSEDDVVRGISGSTRLEAKRQRRRDGRDTGRRRAPILSESEFLARREAVDRAMVIRQQGDRTQIAVLEDDILVEHYVTQAQATSFAGNVYLGRVQNVLPSMEAAFVDIGKGRNAVVYAGEVNWDAAGLSGKQRSIEQAFKSGDKVLVQVTKDPIGHKGARLTQQINLPGRFLVYVPGGSMTGISRKLPDNERQRLKDILKKIVPEDAGVIIRTAAEGASEEELTRDVARLQAQWEVIQKKAETSSNAPTLLYGEPDLAIRVIRDVFNEDFKRLVVQGSDAWDTVEAYVAHVSPELSARLQRYTGTGDVFRDLRVDEQLMKALDRKVFLPSGGSLVIDRTEAMTVVDVNTGKFVGSGGNLEQTVTRNNIEAAEEIVRQLRLRDIGGIIVIDFIDMVLESNRDLVLRRLTECLGRDRTKHQVAEVTSLGLVQMTRKRVGQGLLEVFSEPCEHCRGRGVLVHMDPVDEKRRSGNGSGTSGSGVAPSPAAVAGNGGRSRGQDRTPALVPDTAPAEVTAGEDAPATEAEPAEGQRTGGSRRSRGRRSRGQSGEARAAEDAAVLAGLDTAAPTDQPAEDRPEDAEAFESGAVDLFGGGHAPDEPRTDDVATDDAAADGAGTDDAPVDEAPVRVTPADEGAQAFESGAVDLLGGGHAGGDTAAPEQADTPPAGGLSDAYVTEVRIGEVAPEVAGEVPTVVDEPGPEDVPVPEAPPAEVPAVDVVTVEVAPVQTPEDAPADTEVAPRPRRRRAASRPAGPPA